MLLLNMLDVNPFSAAKDNGLLNEVSDLFHCELLVSSIRRVAFSLFVAKSMHMQAAYGLLLPQCVFILKQALCLWREAMRKVPRERHFVFLYSPYVLIFKATNTNNIDFMQPQSLSDAFLGVDLRMSFNFKISLATAAGSNGYPPFCTTSI